MQIVWRLFVPLLQGPYVHKRIYLKISVMWPEIPIGGTGGTNLFSPTPVHT